MQLIPNWLRKLFGRNQAPAQKKSRKRHKSKTARRNSQIRIPTTIRPAGFAAPAEHLDLRFWCWFDNVRFGYETF